MTSYLEEYPLSRLRRNRQSKWIRNLVSENKLTTDDLIWPIFLCEGENIKKRNSINAWSLSLFYRPLIRSY